MKSRSPSSITPQEDLIFFGTFQLAVTRRELRNNGSPLDLPPKVMDLLILLATANGRIVEKQEIIDTLWPGITVEEGNLTQTVFLLRKLLGESTGSPTFIITVPRRGYRFQGIVATPEVEPPARRPVLWKLFAAAGTLSAAPALLWLARNKRATTYRRLVVLPFVNMSAEPDSEYFCDGLTEEVINALASIGNLQVVARTTAYQFKGKTIDIRRIGEQLNVEAVLEGSVRRQGNTVRVTVQLSNVQNGYQDWSRTFERDASDTFAAQRALAANIAEQFPQPPTAPGNRSAAVSTEAHNLYLRGLHEARKVFGGAAERSLEYYERATAIAPAFAEPYAASSQSYAILGYTEQWAADRAFPKAREAWSRALELNPDLAAAHSARAITLLLYDHDFLEAERAFRKAISLNPSAADARHWYSHCLVALGRIDESLRHSRLAIEWDPLNMDVNAHLSWHYFMARDFPRSIDAARAALGIDATHVPSKIFLSWALVAVGNLPEALDIEAQFKPAKDVAAWKKGFLSGGEDGYWKAKLSTLIDQRSNGNGSLLARAYTYLALRFHSEALDCLEEAAKLRTPQIIYLKMDYRTLPVRANPRFQKLVREIGLT